MAREGHALSAVLGWILYAELDQRLAHVGGLLPVRWASPVRAENPP